MKQGRRLSGSSVVVVLALCAALAGCGSGDDKDKASTIQTVTPPPEPPLQTLEVTADRRGKLRFSPRRLTAKAGRVAILMTNPKSSGKSHGIGITGIDLNVQGLIVKPGELSQAAGEVTPGTYSFYCTIERYTKAGMRGRLIVR